MANESESWANGKKFALSFVFTGLFALILLAGCNSTTPAGSSPSTNAELASLVVAPGTLTPEFSASVTEYEVALAYKQNSITVTGTAADSGATVGGDSGQAKDLEVGTTTVTVKVTAADATTTKSYAVKVTRAAFVPSVTFDKNAADATGTMESLTIAKDSSANLTANAFARTGYTFAGWSTTSTGSVEYADKASYAIGSADVTLYAVWTANTYKVFLDDGSGNATVQTFTYGVSAAL